MALETTPSDSDPKPLIDVMELRALDHEVGNILQPVKQAANMLELDGHELAPVVQAGIDQVMEKVRDFKEQTMLEFPARKFHALLTSLVQQLQHMKFVAEVDLQIEELPKELEGQYIRANSPGWNGLLINLVSNSIRKKATAIKICFRQAETASGVAALEVVIADNGVGMPEDVLQKVRNQRQEQFTDKTIGDGLHDGETHQDHGKGLGMVRSYIETRCMGEMDIQSTQEEGKSGTTISFRLPILHKREDSAHEEKSQDITVAQVEQDACVVRPAGMNRRQVMSIGGAAVVTAASVLFVLNSSEKKQEQHSPLSDVQLDGNGRIQSFSITLGNRKIHIDRSGTANTADFRDAAFIDHEGVSIAGCDVRLGNKFEKMFMASSSHGLFGHLREESGRSVFIHATEPEGAVGNEAICPQTDTVIGMREDNPAGKVQWVATSAKLLQSPTFGSILQDLYQIEQGMQDRVLQPRELSLLARLRRLVHDLQSLHARWGNDAMYLSSIQELNDVLKTRDGKMFVLPEQVARHLHEQPLTQQQVLLLSQHHNMVCLLNTLASDAERYMALPTEESLAVRR